MEAKLRAVKTLGEASDDDDGDMQSWVVKNRKVAQQRQEEAARKAAAEARKKAAAKAKVCDMGHGRLTRMTMLHCFAWT